LAVITYKCPNCGGGLTFDPASQKFSCEYCDSKFDEETLKKLQPDSSADQHLAAEAPPAAQEAAPAAPAQDQSAPGAVVYTCPSCGAEIVTCDTTAATYCFYCHNPVVLAGRLDGRYLPDKIIPFAIPKEKVTEDLKTWLHSKSFVPKSFFSPKQVEKLTGVYFPHWMVDCDVDARLDATARNLRVWTTGDIEYTETSRYHVVRNGTIHFEDLTKSALKKADAMLVEGVQPFDPKGLKDFSMSYLSGFQAEKRDIEQDALVPAVRQEMNDYASSLLQQSIGGYGSVTVDASQCSIKKADWSYALLPVWVLTYRDKLKDKLYYYAVNGQTGKVFGDIPLDRRKLNLTALAVGLAAFALLYLIGWWLV